MDIGAEFLISLVIQLLILAFFVGIYVTTIKFMAKQIEELKEEMRRYNNVLSRLAVAENSIASCHHRVDDWEHRHNNEY